MKTWIEPEGVLWGEISQKKTNTVWPHFYVECEQTKKNQSYSWGQRTCWWWPEAGGMGWKKWVKVMTRYRLPVCTPESNIMLYVDCVAIKQPPPPRSHFAAVRRWPSRLTPLRRSFLVSRVEVLGRRGWESIKIKLLQGILSINKAQSSQS